MSRLEINLKSGQPTEVLINGFDIGVHATEMELYIEPKELPKLTVTLGVFEETSISGDARIFMSLATEGILKEWGWTPPERGGIKSEY